MISVPNLSGLEGAEENARIKAVLPSWLVRKWNTAAVRYADNHDVDIPPFKVFVDFIESETYVACHPISTDYDEFSSNKAKAGAHSPKRTYKSHNVQRAQQPPSCILCNENHWLHQFNNFRAKSDDVRMTIIKTNNRCITCLRAGHMMNDCIFKFPCRRCGLRHNTMLHGYYDKMLSANKEKAAHSSNGVVSMYDNAPGTADNPGGGVGSCSITSEKETEIKVATCNYNNMSGSRVAAPDLSFLSTKSTSRILPVYASNKENPSHEVLVYAMLDEQSEMTFITEKLGAQLNGIQTHTELRLATMTSKSDLRKYDLFSNIVVRGYNLSKRVNLKPCFGKDAIPHNMSVPTYMDLVRWPHLASVASEFPPVFDCEVSLLIGKDCLVAMAPIKSVRGGDEEPYAIMSALGWSMVGPIEPQSFCYKSEVVSHEANCPQTLNTVRADGGHLVIPEKSGPVYFSYNTGVQQEITPTDVLDCLEEGYSFPTDNDPTTTMSQDDIQFLTVLHDSITHDSSDNLYSMPLPFRNNTIPDMPNNRAQAVGRLRNLSQKLKNNQGLKQMYDSFMSQLFANGDAEQVPVDEINAENVWYLPHFGVTNPNKPGKVRVVFDASCSYQGFRLNDSLLQGPDLNNNLIGVLCRFRERQVAVACDIERMFYRFKVDPSHRDALRFLWYDDSGNVTDFRMTKHIFGATSSPGCSKFGLLQVAADHGDEDSLARWFIERCFYVDDGLYSCNTVDEAISLLQDTSEICTYGGLKVHKLMSNQPEVLAEFPKEDLACDLDKFVSTIEDSIQEKALGIRWSPACDEFFFSFQTKSDSYTRRQMLVSVASVFDPLGFVAPLVLVGKQILQKTCNTLAWDDPIPPELFESWNQWMSDMQAVDSIRIPRCVQVPDFGKVCRVELHTFSDASASGYGVCCYLRMINDEGEVSCSLLYGKSRVVPLKGCTIPRLELAAAVLGAKVGHQMLTELSIEVHESYYWSDSEIVLCYIKNSSKRLSMYVLNRVSTICALIRADQWNYVHTSENPADIASRGCTVTDLSNSTWFHGPAMLYDASLEIPITSVKAEIPESDSELRAEKVSFNTTHAEVNSRSVVVDAFERASNFCSAVLVVAMLLYVATSRWTYIFEASVNVLEDAKIHIIRQYQALCFDTEIKALRQGRSVNRSSSLWRLDPYLDESSLIRVGGRLQDSDSLSVNERHPIIIPKKTHLAKLIVRQFHEQHGHPGREFTMSAVRSAGYWVVNLNSVVSYLIENCVQCRKLRRDPEIQKMSDLPKERIDPQPPFTYCGMDCFGPYDVKEGRRVVKKYGIIFTCMLSRAIHVELLDNLSTDAFINSLRCFMAIRGQARQIRCDRGTNFVGAANMFKRYLESVDEQALKSTLLDFGCDFVFNSPNSSHMGGVWERQIKTFRDIFNGLLFTNTTLDVASIRTLFYEAMNIVNSRPLSVVDPDGLGPLTPNHLLHMKSTVVAPPPPGVFGSSEAYSRQRWKRVQQLVDSFWVRWKAHYLNSLQQRKVWPDARNFRLGDVVLLKDDNICRGMWKTCRVVELILSQDGLVRRVRVQVGDQSSGKIINKPTFLERPVHKLVLLIPADNQ